MPPSRRRRPDLTKGGPPLPNSPSSGDQDHSDDTKKAMENPTAMTEMGYVLLSHCSIVLPSGTDYPRQQWMKVNPSSTEASPPQANRETAFAKKDEEESCNTIEPCPHCNVILHHQQHHPSSSTAAMEEKEKLVPLELCISPRHSPRFQGTMADLVHGRQQPPVNVEQQSEEAISPATENNNNIHHHLCRQPRRDDAALVLGAVLQAQEYDYLSIQDVQVMLFPQIDNNIDQTETEETTTTTTSTSNMRAYQASLLVTVSFPSLGRTRSSGQRRQHKANSSMRSIQPNHNSSGSNVKPLPPFVQFVLSILRSDWNHLDQWMKQSQQCDRSRLMPSKKRKRPSFVPSKLSLEELYCRIRGSSGRAESLAVVLPDSQREQQSSSSLFSKSGEKQLALLNLPIDIIQTQITVYLQAKSLDALRCTCKSLHRTLQSVVPGLKLRLFRHQITSLQWMRQRELLPISEAKGHEMLTKIHTTGSTEDSDDNSRTLSRPAEDDNDPIRAMTGGQSVWICPRPTKGEAGHIVKGIRIDQMTGNEMETLDESGSDILARQGARGGLLCDDPGLGKTITVLSLILSTMGVSTEVADKKAHLAAAKGNTEVEENKLESSHSPEEQIFRAYWKEDVPDEYRREFLCRLMRKLKRLDITADYFVFPIDPELHGCKDYLDVIKDPICFNDIYRKIAKEAYGPGNSNFYAFVSDVELCFRNAMEYNPEDHEVHSAAKNLLRRFRQELLVEFKQERLGAIRSSACNTSFKPNSSVALLTRRKAEQEFNQSLLQSSTTLLVIPAVLMEHWQEQIKMHVDFRYLSSRRIPLIYEYTPNRKSALGLEEALRLCKVDMSHEAFIFVDKAGTHKLPSPEFLAIFRIVLTTTKRFTNSWKNGSFQEELQRKNTEVESSGRDGKYLNYRLLEYGPSDEEACPLLKVNWLRLVIDEGHSMGRGKGSSAIRFASWITAQRRWALTGTPTQQTASQNGLSNMHGLMQFLQHDFFTPRKDGDKVWKRLIARNWKDGHLASFFRLKSLLSLLMIRHTKLDIEELSLPIYNTAVVPLSPLEITTYNTVVSAVQANLKLTTMKGSKVSAKQDSLLDRSQAKHALLALTNIRRVCCGGTRVVPRVETKHYVEFVGMCRLIHKMPEITVQELEQYLGRATTEQLSRCSCCGMLLSMLLVFPCGCLVCPECTDNTSNVCVMCNKPFDVDEFQKLQPGMIYEWLKTEDDIEEPTRPESEKAIGNSSGPVNNENGHNENENLDEEGGVPRVGPEHDQMMIRPPSERRRTRKPGDGHVCEYSRSFVPGKCTLCFEMHNQCKLVNKDSCCQVCFQKADDCPVSESKSHYLVNKLLKLYEQDEKKQRVFTPQAARLAGLGDQRRPKVIVFSQFRATLDLVGNRLLKRFGTACVAEYWGSYRTAELHKFVHDPDCFIMLLGKDGSEGLDLSFVTHIFFLEAVWDKSLSQQAVARAWRMGATGPVRVETLLAKNSVEEKMYRLEAGTEVKNSAIDGNTAADDHGAKGIYSAASDEKNAADCQRAKVHYFLKSLNLLADVEVCPLPEPEQVEKIFGKEVTVDSNTVTDAPVEEPRAKRQKTSPRCVRFAV